MKNKLDLDELLKKASQEKPVIDGCQDAEAILQQVKRRLEVRLDDEQLEELCAAALDGAQPKDSPRMLQDIYDLAPGVTNAGTIAGGKVDTAIKK